MKILLLICIIFVKTEELVRSQRTQTSRCTALAINRCRNSVPAPEGVFVYRTCVASNSIYRCLYNCNQRNCNNYCTTLGNGFNSGNCQHDIINRRTTCICATSAPQSSGTTARPAQPQSNNGQQGQAQPNNGQSGQSPNNGQPNNGQGSAPQSAQSGQGPDDERDTSK